MQFPRGVEVVVSAIIENPEREILLVKSPKWQGKWVMPGGHVEPGETITQAVLREAQEETGLKLEAHGVIAWGELIGSKDFHYPAHHIYFDILCRAVSSNVRLDRRELTEYAWVDPKQALTMDLGESYDRTIRAYLDDRE